MLWCFESGVPHNRVCLYTWPLVGGALGEVEKVSPSGGSIVTGSGLESVKTQATPDLLSLSHN